MVLALPSRQARCALYLHHLYAEISGKYSRYACQCRQRGIMTAALCFHTGSRYSARYPIRLAGTSMLCLRTCDAFHRSTFRVAECDRRSCRICFSDMRAIDCEFLYPD